MGGRRRGKLQELKERKRVEGRCGEEEEEDEKEPPGNNKGMEGKVEETEKESGMSIGPQGEGNWVGREGGGLL